MESIKMRDIVVLKAIELVSWMGVNKFKNHCKS
jgi:hypothetical protein